MSRNDPRITFVLTLHEAETIHSLLDGAAAASCSVPLQELSGRVEAVIRYHTHEGAQMVQLEAERIAGEYSYWARAESCRGSPYYLARCDELRDDGEAMPPSTEDRLRAENKLLRAVVDALPRCKVHPCRKPGTWMLSDMKVYCQQHAHEIVVDDWQCSLEKEGTRMDWADAVDALENAK